MQMHPEHSRTRREIVIFSTSHYQKTAKPLDSPAKAGGLTFRLHHPIGNILPLRLRAIKGHKPSPLTVLVSAAHDAQRDGSSESRLAASLVINSKNSFQTEHKLHFLHHQDLEEVDEAHHEFESPL